MKHNDTKDTTGHNGKRENETSRRVLNAAFEVHRALGPGLLESSYESALCRDLQLQSVRFRRQVGIPVFYKGTDLGTAYRLDLIVNGDPPL